MLYGKIIADTVWQNVELLGVKPGGTYSNHYSYTLFSTCSSAVFTSTCWKTSTYEYAWLHNPLVTQQHACRHICWRIFLCCSVVITVLALDEVALRYRGPTAVSATFLRGSVPFVGCWVSELHFVSVPSIILLTAVNVQSANLCCCRGKSPS
jgi:hypothetical protein